LLPFVQVGRPMAAQEGSGLGLPLNRQLIERLGGRFQIASTVGVGTTVTITMPDSTVIVALTGNFRKISGTIQCQAGDFSHPRGAWSVS
jgi:hypothetical protein